MAEATTSPSYRKSECCGGCDCDFLGEKPDEPCWGQVEMDSPYDDEDGCPIPGHLCQGHANFYMGAAWQPYAPYVPESEKDR